MHMLVLYIAVVVSLDPGYGMAALIFNNLLNLFLGTVPNTFKK